MEVDQKWESLLCHNSYLLCTGVPCILKFPYGPHLIYNQRYNSEALEKIHDEFFSYFSPMPLKDAYIGNLVVPGSIMQWEGRTFVIEKQVDTVAGKLKLKYEIFVAEEDKLYSLTISSRVVHRVNVVPMVDAVPMFLLEDEVIRYIHELQYYLGAYLTEVDKDNGTWFNITNPRVNLMAVFEEDFNEMPKLIRLHGGRS